MPGIQKSKEEIKRIDDYVKEHYATDGVYACAVHLQVQEKYIFGRASYLKIKAPKRRKSETSSEKIDRLTKANHELRRDLIQALHRLRMYES